MINRFLRKPTETFTTKKSSDFGLNLIADNSFGMPLALSVIVLILGFNACQKAPVLDCFKSTGKIAQEQRAIGDFKTIVLKNNINLFLTQSDRNNLVVEGGSNLLPKIVTEIQDDTVLVIRNDNKCNWVRSYDKPLNVYLEFTELELLEYRSIGDVTSDDTLKLDSLTVDVKEGAGKIALIVKTPLVYCNLHYGTADIRLRGRADLSYVFGDSFGRIDNRELQVGQVYVTNKSANDMYLYASLKLGATIDNIGNIYYTGNPPEVGLQRNSSGNLIKLD
jgi:hypothetical protein